MNFYKISINKLPQKILSILTSLYYLACIANIPHLISFCITELECKLITDIDNIDMEPNIASLGIYILI